MALHLTANNNKQQISRVAIEGRKLLDRLFSHNDDLGARSSLTFGEPGSCKTAVTCHICEHFLLQYSEDKLFWRSSLNSPLQFNKLERWHIFIEKDSGVRIFNRKTGVDITDILVEQKHISYFKTFAELERKAGKGICNAVFFKDQHLKDIDYDEGTIQWFRFIRYLLQSFSWTHVFLDEYQEMVKSGNSKKKWHEINKHSDDITRARKSNVGIHANCHQTEQLDYRVLTGFMIIIQMYGSRTFKHNMVNKTALGALREPSHTDGAEGWISEAGHYGKVSFRKIYYPAEPSLEARIISEYESIKQCTFCERQYIPKRADQLYCDANCKNKAYRKRNTDNEEE
jgi:hypothetical protein